MDNNKPIDVLRDGSLKATIWENHGENGTYFSGTLAKTYEDKDGKLKDSHSFSGSDWLRISELARQAYARTTQLRRELKQDQTQDHADNYDEEGRESYQGRRRQSRRSRNGSAYRDYEGERPKRRLSAEYPEQSR